MRRFALVSLRPARSHLFLLLIVGMPMAPISVAFSAEAVPSASSDGNNVDGLVALVASQTDIHAFRGKYHVHMDFSYPGANISTKDIDYEYRGDAENYWIKKSPFGDTPDTTLVEAIYNGKYSYRLDRPTPQEPTWKGEVVLNQEIVARETNRTTLFLPMDLFRICLRGKPIMEILNGGNNFMLSGEAGTFLSHWSDGSPDQRDVDVYFYPDGEIASVHDVMRFGFHSPNEMAATLQIPESATADIRLLHVETNYLKYAEVGPTKLPAQIQTRVYHLSKQSELRAIREKLRQGNDTWADHAIEAARISRAMKPGVSTMIEIDTASWEINPLLTERDFQIEYSTGAMVFDGQTGQTYQVRTTLGAITDWFVDLLVWLREDSYRLPLGFFMILGLCGLWLRNKRRKA